MSSVVAPAFMSVCMRDQAPFESCNHLQKAKKIWEELGKGNDDFDEFMDSDDEKDLIDGMMRARNKEAAVRTSEPGSGVGGSSGSGSGVSGEAGSRVAEAGVTGGNGSNAGGQGAADGAGGGARAPSLLGRRDDAGGGGAHAAPACGAPAAIASTDGASSRGLEAAAPWPLPVVREAGGAIPEGGSDGMTAANQNGLAAAAAAAAAPAAAPPTASEAGPDASQLPNDGGAVAGPEEGQRDGASSALDHEGVDDSGGEREQKQRRQVSTGKRPAAAGVDGRALGWYGRLTAWPC